MKILRFDFQPAGKLPKYNDGSQDKLLMMQTFEMKRNITEATTDYDYIEGQSVIDDILDMFRVAVIHDTTGEIQYYINPNDITQKMDGTAANVDGTDGSVFIIKPRFWIKEYDIGNTRYYSISKIPMHGYRKSPRFAIGKYKAHRAYSGSHHNIFSWSGCQIASGSITNFGTRGQFRTAARAGRNNKWNIVPYHIYRDITLLARAKYKTTNFQAELGYVSNANSSLWNNYNSRNPLWETGYMDDQGPLFCGSKPITIPGWPNAPLETEVVSFMGIEDWYGHLYEWLDGIALHWPVGGDPKAYITEDYTKFTDAGSGSTPPDGYNLVGVMATTQNYINEMIEGEIIPKVTGASGASGSTFYSDWIFPFFTSDDHWFQTAVGGSARRAAYSGPFCFKVNNMPNDSNPRITGRLGLYLD